MRGGIRSSVIAALMIMLMTMSGFAVIGVQGSSGSASKPITGIENPVTVARGPGVGNEIARTWVAPVDGYFHQWLENDGLKGVTIYTYDITSAPPTTCSASFITFSVANAYPTGTVQLGYFEVVMGHVYKWTFSPSGKIGTSAEYFWMLEPKPRHPVASFTYSYSGSLLTVDASGSYDPDGTIVQYIWVWGDGTISSGMVSSHQNNPYSAYRVELIVTDNDGLTSSSTQSYTPPPPFDIFGFTRGSDGTPLPDCLVKITDIWTGAVLTAVSDGSGVYQADMNRIVGGWLVGDTIVVAATQGTSSGSSQAVLSDPNLPFLQIDLTLSEPGLGPVAEAGPIQYLCGQDTVQFDGSGSFSAAGIVSYVWTWTSGNSAHRSVEGMTPMFPSEWFFSNGNYTVTLTITDGNGRMATDTVSISFGFRLTNTDRGAEGIVTPSDGYFKLRIENHGMNSFDWTIIDCSLTVPPYDVFHSKVTFSAEDQVLVTDLFWMQGGRWYQSEYELTGPAGSYMTIFSFFVPT